MHKAYLGLGSNLGNREELIRQSVTLIAERAGKVLKLSSLIETTPWGFESENRFLNGVVLIETELTPRQLLDATQQIERELGKRRKHTTKRKSQCVRYSDRPIDIDILLYDDLTIDEPDLKIPHPLMHERDFVMTPLNELIHNN